MCSSRRARWVSSAPGPTVPVGARLRGRPVAIQHRPTQHKNMSVHGGGEPQMMLAIAPIVGFDFTTINVLAAAAVPHAGS